MCASISEHRRDIPMTRKKIGCISEQKFQKINMEKYGHNLRQNKLKYDTAFSKKRPSAVNNFMQQIPATG